AHRGGQRSSGGAISGRQLQFLAIHPRQRRGSCIRRQSENSVKLIGNDVVVLTETAEKIKDAMSKVRGVADLAVFTSLGQPTLRIDIDRKAAARYGLAPGDINSAVQTAVGGQAAGDLYEEGSDRHFPLVVRLAPKYRQNIETISGLTIAVQDP